MELVVDSKASICPLHLSRICRGGSGRIGPNLVAHTSLHKWSAVVFHEHQSEVITIGRCLPYIDSCSSNGLACCYICDLTVHESDLSVFGCIEADCGAVWAYWVVLSPEWTQDGRGCEAIRAFCGSRECDVVH